MRNISSATLVLSLIALAGTAEAQAPSAPQGLAVRIVNGSAPGGARLAIAKDGGERGAIALPAGLAPDAIDQGLRGALWHPNGRDVALAFKGPKASFVVVFLQQADGSYLAVDVSNVEQVNIGAIGPFRTYKDRQTKPVEWLNLSRITASPGSRLDGAEAVQIRLRTEVRDLNGTRYAMAEPLIITRDGTPLWR